MKKIFFVSLLLFLLGGMAEAQTATPATTSKKQTIKSAGSVSTAPVVTKTSTSTNKNTNSKPGASTTKVTAATIGKHKKTHHKAAKKPGKKS
jgi:hypothetical protein